MVRAPSDIGAASLLAFVVACAGSQPNDTVGGSARGRSIERAPVELVVDGLDGQKVHIRSFRGRTTLLFVFATFDGVSQAALRPLREFTTVHSKEVAVLGIASQPGGIALLDAWVHALDPPFLVAYDAEQTIARGKSALGELEAVPACIMLNRRGIEVARHVGFPGTQVLERLLRTAQETR